MDEGDDEEAPRKLPKLVKRENCWGTCQKSIGTPFCQSHESNLSRTDGTKFCPLCQSHESNLSRTDGTKFCPFCQSHESNLSRTELETKAKKVLYFLAIKPLEPVIVHWSSCLSYCLFTVF